MANEWIANLFWAKQRGWLSYVTSWISSCSNATRFQRLISVISHKLVKNEPNLQISFFFKPTWQHRWNQRFVFFLSYLCGVPEISIIFPLWAPNVAPLVQWTMFVGTGGEPGDTMPPRYFGRSVHTISTRGQLCPPHYYLPPRFSDLPTVLWTMFVVDASLARCIHRI